MALVVRWLTSYSSARIPRLRLYLKRLRCTVCAWATDRRLVVEPSPSHPEYGSLRQGPAWFAGCTGMVGDWLRASTPQSQGLERPWIFTVPEYALGAQLLSQ